MATINRINPNNRNIVPGIGQENNIFVKSGDVNPLIDQVNANTTAIAAIVVGTTPATVAELRTGTDDTNFVTPKTLADQALTFGAATMGFTGTLTNTGKVNATNFDTNVAAAGVTLSGTTLAADGTDAAIPITITPKGVAGVLNVAGSAAAPAYSFTSDPDTGIIDSSANAIGFVTNATEQWTINASGSLVPAVSTNDIGSSAAAVEKIYAQYDIIKATDTNAKYGLLTRKYVTAKATLGAEPTEITVGIPAGVRLLAVQFTVSTEITAATATSWKASFTGGSTAVIDGGTNAFALNTKLNVLLSETTMAATAVTTDVTQISIISNDASDFTSGEISAIVYYEELTSITN
jgi:hypothetical protein